jgi:hypothetical protein
LIAKSFLIVLLPLSFFFLSTEIVNGQTGYSSRKGVGETIWPLQASVCDSEATCLQYYWNRIKELGIKWLYNWDTPDDGNRPAWMMDNTIEYVPKVGKPNSETNATIESYARNNHGSYWLIWNEPDVSSQDNLPADTAASIYDSLRGTILGADPSAKLIVGNVAGLGWLMSFREAYKNSHNGNPPVVEGWAGHLYRDRSTYNIQNWRSDLYAYRNWMVSIGEGTKEFWLTEFGCLTDNEIGLIIMNDQLTWLEESAQSWITRYAWFHAGVYGSAHPGEQGHLFTNSVKDMTVDFSPLGVKYASHPGPSPIYHGCPDYYTNCRDEYSSCPAGTVYDRLGSCGNGKKCCNPYLPTPTRIPTLTPTPTIIDCPNGNLGNLNCDSGALIDETDLSIFLGSWTPFGPVPTPVLGHSSADISPTGGDGKIDSGDLTVLLGNWGSQ